MCVRREKNNPGLYGVFVLRPLAQQSRCVALKLSPFSLPCDDDGDDDDVCGGTIAGSPFIDKQQIGSTVLLLVC